ncbi:MAG: hypothetical protein HQ483_14805 [Rhodospirillales bacterium]|nr:hypothetical protein [Rhodospirillales bacterium]
MKNLPPHQSKPFAVLGRALRDQATSWSLGTFGALAEFFHDPGEIAAITETATGLSARTALGSLHVQAHPELRLVAYEGLSSLANAWTQGVLVCLPTATAQMGRRRGIWEIGPDHAALCGGGADAGVDAGADAVVFDLGLDVAHLDACIRTRDQALIALLRQHPGRSLFDQTLALARAVRAASPDRIFASKIARIEVYQEIPADGGETPLGPHTHLSEKLLARRQTQAATVPVPAGWVPVLAFYPPNPLRDTAGNLRPFDPAAFARFQELLHAFGSAELTHMKKQFDLAMESGAGPQAMAPPKTKAARTALRIAMRQYHLRFGPSDLLAQWQMHYEPKTPPS